VAIIISPRWPPSHDLWNICIGKNRKYVLKIYFTYLSFSVFRYVTFATITLRIPLEVEFGGYIFQDDNAPCHASRRAVQWKRENKLNCLNWPSQSSDLNIIENVWRTIKIKLQNSKCDILNNIKGNASPKHHCYTGTTPQTNTFRSPNFISLSPNMHSPVIVMDTRGTEFGRL
jgi:hypothetical protein